MSLEDQDSATDEHVVGIDDEQGDADGRDATGGQDDDESTRDDRKYAWIGGALATLVAFGAMGVVGFASSGQARALVQAILPTVRFAASAYIAAGSTILALMLTMITFSISDEREFRSSHFQRIRQVSKMTAAVIVASTLTLMFLSFPLLESDTEQAWYLPVYYVLLFVAAVTGGLFITVILMLYYAARELLNVADSSATSKLVVQGGGPGNGRRGDS